MPRGPIEIVGKWEPAVLSTQSIFYILQGTLVLTLGERGEGERLCCLRGDSCGRKTRDVVIRRYAVMGICTFTRVLPSQLYSVTQPLMVT